jgi:hypothetical protein
MRKKGGAEFESLCPYLGTFVILFDIDTYFTKFVKEDFEFAKVNLRKGSINGSLSGSISLSHLFIFYNISCYNSLVLLTFVSRSSCRFT